MAKKYNKLIFDGNICHIIIEDVHGRPIAEAVIDATDSTTISSYRWIIRKDRHYIGARTKIDGKYIILSRFLMKPQENMVVDHINGDQLDNRRSNLRICSIRQNVQNAVKARIPLSSKYKWVYWSRAARKWAAEVNKTYLGLFASEEDAARIADEYAKQAQGPFARCNFC